MSEKKFDIKKFDPNNFKRIEDMPPEARGYFMSVPKHKRKSAGLTFEPNEKFYDHGGSIQLYKRRRVELVDFWD